MAFLELTNVRKLFLNAQTAAVEDFNLDVNTKGVFLCCQEAIRRFRASGTKGRLINTASGQARVVDPSGWAHTAE